MDVSLFKSQVQCTGTVTTPPESCGYIIAEMIKDYSTEKFGVYSEQQQSVDVALPLVLKARKYMPYPLTSPPRLPSTSHPSNLITTNIPSNPADGRCQLTINVTGGEVKAMWGHVWLATEALVAKCVRGGSGSKAIVESWQDRPGRQPPPPSELYVSVTDEPAPSGVSAAVSGTGTATA